VDDLGELFVWGCAVGGSLAVGALVAAFFRLPDRWAALLTAFGGGLLLSAVAFELVPEADDRAGLWLTAAGLIGGTMLYVVADGLLGADDDTEAMRRAGQAAAAGRTMAMPERAELARGEAIAVGLTVDGIPESIALGLTVAEGSVGLALAAGVVVGNLVEAYGAAQPIISSGRSRRFAVLLLTAIGVALLVATVLGGTAFADAFDGLVGTAQAIAAGAVLGVVSIAVIPHAFKEVNATVATATVLGFTAGYLLS